MIAECCPPDMFDEVEAASLMPDHPNVWTDGSLVLDRVTGVSSSCAGFFLLPKLRIARVVVGGIMLIVFALRARFSLGVVSAPFLGLCSLFGNSAIDARRNLSGVCGRWYPVLVDLHRFFIAISRAVDNHDGNDGTAPDPLVWSAGALPKRRRLVHAVRDRAFFPGPPGIWDSEWVNVPASALCAEDIAHWR